MKHEFAPAVYKSNSDRLICDLEVSVANHVNHVDFAVGKYTGNGPSVVAALRRRGFEVSKIAAATYRLHAKDVPLPKPYPPGYMQQRGAA